MDVLKYIYIYIFFFFTVHMKINVQSINNFV